MEPNVIRSAVHAATSGARVATRYLPEPLSRGVDFLTSLARSGRLDTSAIPGDTQELINRQIELQQEMLQVTLFTNLERTRHETQMAPARNIRLT